MCVKDTCCIDPTGRKKAEYLEGGNIRTLQNKRKRRVLRKRCYSKYQGYDNSALQPGNLHRIAVINDAKAAGASSAETTHGCCLHLLLNRTISLHLCRVGMKSVKAHLCTQTRALAFVHAGAL